MTPISYVRITPADEWDEGAKCDSPTHPAAIVRTAVFRIEYGIGAAASAVWSCPGCLTERVSAFSSNLPVLPHHRLLVESLLPRGGAR